MLETKKKYDEKYSIIKTKINIKPVQNTSIEPPNSFSLRHVITCLFISRRYVCREQIDDWRNSELIISYRFKWSSSTWQASCIWWLANFLEIVSAWERNTAIKKRDNKTKEEGAKYWPQEIADRLRRRAQTKEMTGTRQTGQAEKRQGTRH